MSALTFRNVDASPANPVSDWPTEAIQTALERGGLSDWRRLATAVNNAPWGPVTRQIEEVLGYSRPYGIAEAMERVIARARAKAERSERDQVAQEVNRLIDESGLTRTEFASRIGTSASRLSTYATGRVTPSAALLLRMLGAAGFASLAGTWSGRVRLADDEMPESLGARPEHS
jgi:DNA-binding transcriptional regulator YiaG